MKKAIVLCFALLVGACCQGADPTAAHLAKVSKFFDITQMEKTYETSLTAGFEGAAHMGDTSAMPEEERAKMEKALKRVKEFLVTEIGWSKIKEDMAKVYAKHFTEDELDKVIKLLDSETGRMFISKQIGLLAESMALAQSRAQALMPKVIAMMQEEMSK
ncbi:MAG: DUF2059 domain-containing protein [Verrucomicrobiota bacterium]